MSGGAETIVTVPTSTPVEKLAGPDDNLDGTPPPPSPQFTRRTKLIAAFVAGLAAVVAIAVGVGVSVGRSSGGDSSANAASARAVDTSPASASPVPVTTTAPLVPTVTTTTTSPSPRPPSFLVNGVDPELCDQSKGCTGFEGWGTSLAWDSTALAQVPDAVKTAYMDAIFDRTKGLGLTYARYNIFGGENPDPAHYQGRTTQHMDFFNILESFQPQPGKYTWTADQNQRWMLAEARKRGANLFEAYSSGPPYYMTVSGCSAGQYQPGVVNLQDGQYGAFADYLTEVVRFFRDEPTINVTFRTLAPLNEPTGVWWVAGNRQEGCFFDVPSQARVIAAVSASLAGKGLTATTLAIPDEVNVATAIRSIQGLPAAAIAAASQYNVHSYGDGGPATRIQLGQLARGAGKRMSMSEYGCCLPPREDGLDATEMGNALITARQIIADITNLGAATWAIWQPTWNFVVLDASGVTLRKPYYFLLHFSRFIRPGARILAIDAETMGGLSRDGTTLAYVVFNDGQGPVYKDYDLSGYPRLTKQAVVWRTDADVSFVNAGTVAVDPTVPFAITVPAQSILSLVFTIAV